MAATISFQLTTLLALLSVVTLQDGVHAELAAPRWQAIKPSRMSAYVRRVSDENNKRRISGAELPTVTRTATELHTLTVIKTVLSTVVETTIVNALRETSIYVPVTVTVTAAPETMVVYVRQVCPVRDFLPVDNGDPEPESDESEAEPVVGNGFMNPETGNVQQEDQGINVPQKDEPVKIADSDVEDSGSEGLDVPEDESLESLVSYLNEFHEVVGHLDVPRNRRKVLLSFVKYTSEESLGQTTLAQRMVIKDQLKSLCEVGMLVGDDSEPFFEMLAGFVKYLKISAKKIV